MSHVATELEHGSGLWPQRDVAFVRGEGAALFTEDGTRFVDCASGHGVANVGHAHPRVASAIAEQAARLTTCPATFVNDQRATLLARLAAITPEGIDRFFLCNSGTEAAEAALKFARITTGRTGFVAMRRGFHGRTLGALSATADRKYREPFAPLVPEFAHVAYDNLEALTATVGGDTAGVMLEIVQGEGGVHPASREFLRGVRELCDRTGSLMIVDEVQTGFGRTGRMFACEHDDVRPDLLCLGKAIAGGVPMGAVGIGARVGELPRGSHGSTFGGNPLACAASLATLDVIESEGLVRRSEELGAWLLDRLQSLDSPHVRSVRGRGLMVGIECKQRVAPILRGLFARGVLALAAGPTVLRLLPPLMIPREELEQAVDAIDAELGALA